MVLGSALGLVLLARNAGIAISHPAGFCTPSVGPYYIPSFCVAGMAQSHIHREFLWQPWYNFMQGVVQIAATKCEKGAVQGFMQGACKIVVAKSGKGAVQGVVQVLCRVVWRVLPRLRWRCLAKVLCARYSAKCGSEVRQRWYVYCNGEGCCGGCCAGCCTGYCPVHSGELVKIARRVLCRVLAGCCRKGGGEVLYRFIKQNHKI